MQYIVCVCVRVRARACVHKWMYVFVRVCITSLDDTFLQQKAYVYPFFIITVRSGNPKLASTSTAYVYLTV